MILLPWRSHLRVRCQHCVSQCFQETGRDGCRDGRAEGLRWPHHRRTGRGNPSLTATRSSAGLRTRGAHRPLTCAIIESVPRTSARRQRLARTATMLEGMSPKSDFNSTGFSMLGLDDALVASVTALGYEEPTPSSARRFRCCSPAATCSGRRRPAPARPRRSRCRCCSGIAQLGRAGAAAQPRGLILVPTRELAMQVAEAVHKYARGDELDACCRSTAARRCTSRSARSSAAPTSSSPRRAARSITSAAAR